MDDLCLGNTVSMALGGHFFHISKKKKKKKKKLVAAQSMGFTSPNNMSHSYLSLE